jgi:hypothetical protein
LEWGFFDSQMRAVPLDFMFSSVSHEVICVQGVVYFFPRNDILTLNYFDFSTRKVRPMFMISGGGAFPGLSVSSNGRYILYPELDDYRSDIMLVENFH